MRIVLTSRLIPSNLEGIPILELGGLSLGETLDIARVGGLSAEVIEHIASASEGNPLFARLMTQYALKGDPLSLFERLGDAGLPTILGPDGTPIDGQSKELQKVEITASGVSDELIKKLAAKPDGMYSISSRKFEELVAELYDREGYDVELTPVSRDGGVDVYAVQRTAFGSFLTVIDCKRFRKDRPVEVGLIRQLFGAVEAKDASVGVLATTSYFSKGAEAFQEERKYRLGLQDFLSIQEMLQRQSR